MLTTRDKIEYAFNKGTVPVIGIAGLMLASTILAANHINPKAVLELLGAEFPVVEVAAVLMAASAALLVFGGLGINYDKRESYLPAGMPESHYGDQMLLVLKNAGEGFVQGFTKVINYLLPNQRIEGSIKHQLKGGFNPRCILTLSMLTVCAFSITAVTASEDVASFIAANIADSAVMNLVGIVEVAGVAAAIITGFIGTYSMFYNDDYLAPRLSFSGFIRQYALSESSTDDLIALQENSITLVSEHQQSILGKLISFFSDKIDEYQDSDLNKRRKEFFLNNLFSNQDTIVKFNFI